MNWQHRMVRGEGGVTTIQEVFFDEAGDPWGCGRANAIHDPGFDDDEPVRCIQEQLEQMREATLKPILDYPADFTGHGPTY